MPDLMFIDSISAGARAVDPIDSIRCSVRSVLGGRPVRVGVYGPARYREGGQACEHAEVAARGRTARHHGADVRGRQRHQLQCGHQRLQP
eukprot:15287841-Alexandrium_andersonii.AAC.1